jgi:hypothetical protein
LCVAADVVRQVGVEIDDRERVHAFDQALQPSRLELRDLDEMPPNRVVEIGLEQRTQVPGDRHERGPHLMAELCEKRKPLALPPPALEGGGDGVTQRRIGIGAALVDRPAELKLEPRRLSELAYDLREHGSCRPRKIRFRHRPEQRGKKQVAARRVGRRIDLA